MGGAVGSECCMANSQNDAAPETTRDTGLRLLRCVNSAIFFWLYPLSPGSQANPPPSP